MKKLIRCKVFYRHDSAMTLSRRMLLKSATAFPLSVRSAFAAGDLREADAAGKTLFLMLDQIDHALAPALVTQALELFFQRGIPVALVLDDFARAAPAGDDRDAFLHQIGDIATRETGLFEIVLAHESNDAPERYFQLRNAAALRQRVAGSGLGRAMGAQAGTLVSLIDISPSPTLNPYAFRAAGFRIHIRPAQGAQGGDGAPGSRVAPLDWGLLAIEGGSSAAITDDPAAVLNRALGGDGDQLLTLSFGDAAALAPDALLAACAAWADRLQNAFWNGEVFVTRPVDYLLQGNPGASKYVALLLDRTGADAGGDAMSAFAETLEQEGFAATILSREATAGCVAVAGGPPPGAQPDPTCIFAPDLASAASFPNAEIVVLAAGAPGGWSGQRADGSFQIALSRPGHASFGERLGADPMSDQVELIDPSRVATPIQRRLLLGQLMDARRDGRVHFYSLRGFMQAIVAPDPVLRRLWSTRRRQVSDPARDAPRRDTDRLLDDARLAWRYIDRFSDDKTGLCGGTASVSTLNRALTLWDVASQLFAILSARDLKIIAQDEARARVRLILDNMPVTRIDDLPLPPALFRANTLTPVKPGYDACDTGRFLIALDALVAAGLAGADQAASLLGRWDLAATIRDRRVFSHARGEWVDRNQSHCTPYTRRGFAAWGMEVDTPYPALTQPASGDARMRLLYKAAFLGQIGTEPFLLEAVEHRQSPQSRYLSDVLFDAQLGWFEQTGKLKCVSEAPLNFDPWFIYQGLRIDRTGEDAWGITTQNKFARYATPEFRARVELISAKSAYLWAAAYPHPYSDRLVDLIRSKARIEGLGFSVGVFASSLEPMQGYSDLNTNGIILTAIARMLRA